MVGCIPSENRLVCDTCGRDTFAVRRENGLEMKYRDRWMMILNDSTGTILFRCRFCGNITAYSLSGNNGAEMHPSAQEDIGNRSTVAFRDREVNGDETNEIMRSSGWG
jgi:hypothetical protein